MKHSHHFIRGTNTPMCTCIMYLSGNELVSEVVLRRCSDSPPLSRLIFLSRDSVTFTCSLVSVACLFFLFFSFCFFSVVFVFGCIGPSEFPLCFAFTGRCIGFHCPGCLLRPAVKTFYNKASESNSETLNLSLRVKLL